MIEGLIIFINRSFFPFVCRAVILYQECSNGGQTGSEAVNKARMKIVNQGKNHPFVITKERVL